MQYQVADKDGNIVAWIDTEKSSQIVEKGYIVLRGDKLIATEIDDRLKIHLTMLVKRV